MLPVRWNGEEEVVVVVVDSLADVEEEEIRLERNGRGEAL
jgi:hypothetical protein